MVVGNSKRLRWVQVFIGWNPWDEIHGRKIHGRKIHGRKTRSREIAVRNRRPQPLIVGTRTDIVYNKNIVPDYLFLHEFNSLGILWKSFLLVRFASALRLLRVYDNTHAIFFY